MILLGENEKVLWADKPKLIPFVVNESCKLTAMVILVLGIYTISNCIFQHDYPAKVLFFIMVGFMLLISCKTAFDLNFTRYIITNRRIIISTYDGLSTENKIVSRNKVQSKEVTSSIIEKYFDTGSIKIYSGETDRHDGSIEKVYDIFHSISNPRKVLDLL